MFLRTLPLCVRLAFNPFEFFLWYLRPRETAVIVTQRRYPRPKEFRCSSDAKNLTKRSYNNLISDSNDKRLNIWMSFQIYLPNSFCLYVNQKLNGELFLEIFFFFVLISSNLFIYSIIRKWYFCNTFLRLLFQYLLHFEKVLSCSWEFSL